MKQSTFLPTHLVLLLALAWAPTYTKKQAKDYNGTIFTKQGITLTPSSIYYDGPLQAITSPQLAGYLDQTFNATGTVVIPTFGGGNDDQCNALQLQPDGKLVLAGYSQAGGGLTYSAVRLNNNGSLDTSFGNRGTAVIPTFGGSNIDQCSDLQLQPDGKLVLAGYSQIPGGGTCYSAVRLTNQTPTLQDYQTVYPSQGGFY